MLAHSFKGKLEPISSRMASSLVDQQRVLYEELPLCEGRTYDERDLQRSAALATNPWIGSVLRAAALKAAGGRDEEGGAPPTGVCVCRCVQPTLLLDRQMIQPPMTAVKIVINNQPLQQQQ